MPQELTKREILFNLFYTPFRWKRLITGIFLITFLSMMLGTFLVTPLWKATTKILIEPNPKQQIMIFDNMAVPQPDIGGVNPAVNLVEIMTSRSMAEEIVREFGLDLIARRKAEEPSNLREKTKIFLANILINYPIRFIGWMFGFPPGEKNFLSDAIEDFIKEAEDIEIEQDTSILNITIWGETPGMATDIANRLAEKLTEKVLYLTRGKAAIAYAFVKSQVVNAKNDLEEAEDKLKKYKKNNVVVMLDEQKRTAIEALAGLETELNLVKISREETKERIKEIARQLENQQETIVISTVLAQNPQINELKNTLKNLEVKLASILTERMEGHPDVVGIKASILETKRKLKQEMEMVLQSKTNAINPFYQDLTNRLISLKVDNLALIAKKAALKDAVTKLKEDEFDRYPTKERELATLTREVLIQEDLYRNLKSKLEALAILKRTSLGDLNLKVIDEAFLFDDAKRNWPSWAVNIIFGLILSSAWALGVAFFLEYWNDYFRTANELEKKTGRYVLGSVPFISGKKSWLTKDENKKLEEEQDYNDALREIAKNIPVLLGQREEKVYLLSGISPKCGKTTLALGLCKNMAELGIKVLLIEGVLEEPVLASLLGIENTNGLIEYLNSGISKDIIKKCATNLCVITGGGVGEDKNYILWNEKIIRLFDKCKEHFDIIIVDTPPVSSPDTIHLSLAADGVVMLVEAEKDTVEEAANSIARVEDRGGKAVSLILNKERATIPKPIRKELNL